MPAQVQWPPDRRPPVVPSFEFRGLWHRCVGDFSIGIYYPTLEWGRMMAGTDWPKAALTTEAIQLLDAILREWCAENECDRGRLTAKSLVE